MAGLIFLLFLPVLLWDDPDESLEPPSFEKDFKSGARAKKFTLQNIWRHTGGRIL
jgi:hypothetical protein